MVDPEVLERIAVRRAELGGLEEQLVKQLDLVRAERDELAVAERFLARMSELIAGVRTAVAPASARVGGRAVLLVPHRGESPDEAALPGDCRRILAIVRAAGGPVQVRAVGEELGLQAEVHGSWSRCGRSWSSSRTAAGCELARRPDPPPSEEDRIAVAGPVRGEDRRQRAGGAARDQRPGDLAGGNAVHRTTVSRWVREVVGLLAARASRLNRALKKIARSGGGVVLLDGSLIRTHRRTGTTGRTTPASTGATACS
ncbi:hypothetical protein [Actinacidiphila glaucinigra]|uniref:Transposase n=1 Tax=Actinacidiphila glaucinigra TaxID=235986 RepID=A0A239P0L4_9ACTN|nr:hypothetical protein [Actinacidiphila glaucinigra]SNT60144.1 hypothetical protein SAMN05216252_1612 [Actinacidiphila glaucinigra]